MEWKNSLEYNDLIPMALAHGFITDISEIHYIDNLKLYQSLGNMSGSFFLYSSPNAILNRYFNVGALEFGLNQLCYLRQGLREEMDHYVKRHSQYFNHGYRVFDEDSGPLYLVSFPDNCSNNCQYLLDVIHELASKMRWNRPSDFLDISGIYSLCQYDKIYYDEEQMAIVLKSPTKTKIYQQKKMPEKS